MDESIPLWTEKSVKEGNVYKMLRSNIIDVYNPSWDWFEGAEF